MPVTEPRNSQGLPLFSQSLEAQKLRQLPPPHDKFFVPQAFLLTLPVLAMGAFLIVARPNIAQTGKAGKFAKSTVEKLTVIAQNNTASDETDIALEPAEESGRRPLDFYTGGIRSNMFSPPQPPKPIVKKAPVVRVKVEKPVIVKVPDVVLPPINPFQDWSYTGVIKMGETRMALLENTKTKEGQYVKEGESFLGAQVGTITDQSITLSSGGTPQTLAKSDTIVVTPLNANAPGMGAGAQPQPGQMPPGGMPQMPQGMPMMQGGMQGSVILPNGRALSPEQAARRAEFMNGNFRGGGGRGGRNR